jgi:hypothetical protein
VAGLNVVDAQHSHQHVHTAPVLAHTTSPNAAQQQQQQQGLNDLAHAAAAAAAADSTAAAPAATSVVLPAWTLSPLMLREALLLHPTTDIGDEGDLFLEQAVIAVRLL